MSSLTQLLTQLSVEFEEMYDSDGNVGAGRVPARNDGNVGAGRVPARNDGNVGAGRVPARNNGNVGAGRVPARNDGNVGATLVVARKTTTNKRTHGGRTKGVAHTCLFSGARKS